MVRTCIYRVDCRFGVIVYECILKVSEAMACKGSAVSWDPAPIKHLLYCTNYAEDLEAKPRHHVERIGVIITVLADEFGADDNEDYSKVLSKEKQELLNWQHGTKDLQDDAQFRNNLSEISGKLCPKPFSQSFFAKVTDRDTHQQKTEASCCRHVMFRTAMLTQHSASGGQVQLLYSHDGLRDRSCMRWRSYDHIKLLLPEGRSFRVFWLIHWDVVDMTDRLGDQHVVTGRNNVNQKPPPFESPASQPQSTSKQKLPPGVRLDKKRKSPYIAEVRGKGVIKDKLWLGSYETAEAAARAVDAGNFYYNPLKSSYNFPDSPSFLISTDLDGKRKEEFVKVQAHKLASLAKDIIEEGPSHNTSHTALTRPLDVGSFWNGMQRPPRVNFVQELPRLDDCRPQLASSSSDSDVRPSTPCGGVFLQEPCGCSSSEYLREYTPPGYDSRLEPIEEWLQWFLDQ